MPGTGVTIGRGVSAVPASFDPVKIAILGASESARSANTDNTWPARFNQILCDGGPNDALVKNLGYHGATFSTAMNSAFYGANTMVQECILWRPDIVFVEFGGNDALNVGTSLAQMKIDADALYTAVRAGLPNALIIGILEQPVDLTNFPAPGTTLKNKGIATQFMELTAAGVGAGFYCSELLDVACTAPLKTKAQNLVDLNTYMSVGPSSSFTILGSNTITMNFWKLQRLGITVPDMAHHNIAGHQLQAAWVYKGAKALTSFQAKFPRLSSQIITDWQDPDALFTHYLVASGDGWVRQATADVPGLNASDVNRWWGIENVIAPETYYLPSKADVALWPANLIVYQTTEWPGFIRLLIRGGPPTQLTYISIDAAAFISSGESTDAHGNFETSMGLGGFGLSAGAHTIRFKCGTEVYGPYTITIGGILNNAQYTNDAATITDFTLTTAQTVGGRTTVMHMTGTPLAAQRTMTTPTAAQLLAALAGATAVGFNTWIFRVVNQQAGAFAWLLAAGAGVTVSGTATVAQNTWRDFLVTYTAATPTFTFRSIATGTMS